MRRVVLTFLAAIGVAAGLAVTASSTTHVAFGAGMHGLALAAIVVVLEVTNVLGTWVLLTDERTHACVEAGVFVALASLVTGWCGLLTYGLIGLVGPAFVLGGVELARLASSTPKAAVQGNVGKTPRADAPSAPEAWGPPEAVAPEPPTRPVPVCLAPPTPVQPTQPAQSPTTVQPTLPTPEPPTSAQGGQPTPEVGEQPTQPTDEEIADWVAAQAAARGRRPGRDAIKTEWGVGTRKAERALTLHDSRPRLTVAGKAAR